MKLQKPDLHLLTVWRLRLLLVTLLPSSLSAYFSAWQGLFWWIFTISWAAAFLAFYLFYYPIKFRKLSYSRNSQYLLLHCGVIYTRVKAMPLDSIQYTAIASSPLQRLFHVHTLLIYAAGACLRLPGLPLETAKQLQQELTPAPPEGGDPLA